MRILFFGGTSMDHDELRKSGFVLDVAEKLADGLWLAESRIYDVIILDAMPPDVTALQILGMLHEKDIRTHVLMITGDTGQMCSCTKALTSGADECIRRPFEYEELRVRLQKLVSRKYGTRKLVLRVASLTVDLNTHCVTLGKRAVKMTPREYKTLIFLIHKRNTVVSRSEIEEHIYEHGAEIFSNAVDSTMCNLRNKLKNCRPPLIQTRRGAGYILIDRTSSGIEPESKQQMPEPSFKRHTGKSRA